ncbi:MAG: peptide chain release factor N(5)-glutamine methyltransferase [Alphaproteobacteria bacterium]|nr:peptide chain release factor N(5)-glutamine methyltransferase [Alphaproteobacteria bacterium]
MATLTKTLCTAVRVLHEAGIEDAELDAKLLASFSLKTDRLALLTQGARELTPEERAGYAALIERRAMHEPVGRIMGHSEFWGLPIGLNRATLEPRQDSETLIDAALGLFPDHRRELRMLDLGTGSGCLLLALLSEFPRATGLGTDTAPDAVEQAIDNAEALGLHVRAKFIETAWASGVPEQFDLVVSNPPYIRSDEIASLMPEVSMHDPRAALDGGADGLDAYRAIAQTLPRLLKPEGCAVLEVGHDQAALVVEIMAAAGLKNTRTRRDLSGIERCVIANI